MDDIDLDDIQTDVDNDRDHFIEREWEGLSRRADFEDKLDRTVWQYTWDYDYDRGGTDLIHTNVRAEFERTGGQRPYTYTCFAMFTYVYGDKQWITYTGNARQGDYRGNERVAKANVDRAGRSLVERANAHLAGAGRMR